MGIRRSSHQPGEERRSLATGWGAPTEVKIPLLPYERELIEVLGCTEEEYEEYRKQLINYGKCRPAAYDHIPDIRNEPTTVAIVSLVVGLAISAASALLAPKPKAPEQQEDKQKKLTDSLSKSRFNNTQGFDGTQAVSTLGTPVASFFGKREGNHGGLFLQPQLLWSRMFSYGTHQGFLGGYLIGEVLEGDVTIPRNGRYDKPEIAGIQLGTGPLSQIDKSQYAVYWRSNYVDGRLKRTDLLYGTDGYPAAGNPNPNQDILSCPIRLSSHAPGFCMTYVPSGDTTFGVYSPINNGQGWKLNYRIVQYPFAKKDTDPNNRIKAERCKIVGYENAKRGEGMRGTGCGFSPFMGIIRKNGGPEPNTPVRNEVCIVGDTIEFIIRKNEILKNDYKSDVFGRYESSDVGMEDIAARIDTLRSDADDLLQLGEIFMIGRTLWQVRNRTGGNSYGAWEPRNSSQDVRVTLQMIETTTNAGASAIGIAGKKATGNSRNDIQLWDGYESSSDAEGWLGPAFWPLLRCSFSNIKNTRPVECTEFGIKSQVWNKSNGLCNFASLLQADALAGLEEDGFSVTSGQQSKYFARTSAFTIWLRPVGMKENGDEYEWGFLGETFVVTGSQPVDQFNFIRLKNNDGPRQMEFRFIPRSFADIQFYVNSEENFWRIDSKTGREIGADFTTPYGYGTWRLTTVGEIVTKKTLLENKEMIQYDKPGSTESNFVASAVSFDGLTPSYPTEARYAAWKCDVFGDPNNYWGQSKNVTVSATSGKGTVRVKCFARQIYSPFQDYNDKFGPAFWDVYRFEVESSDAGFREGDRVTAERNANNRFGNRVGLSRAGVIFNITQTRRTDVVTRPTNARYFESTSQMAEVSNYTEISKSCDNGPEHAVVYVNESVSPDFDPDMDSNGGATYPFTMMGLSLRSSNAIKSVEQLNIWLGNGVSTRLNTESTAETAVRGPTNLFADVVQYLLTNEVGGLGEYITPDFVDRDGIAITAKYQKANGIYFDGAISDRTNARSYLTDVAPYHLSNFVIKDGVFSMTPALPYNGSYKIDPTAINVAGMFNERNILDGSFQLNYLDINERKDFKVIVKYRDMPVNSTPFTRSLLVRWNEEASLRVPQEEIDLTGFCTSKDHAEMVAKFLLSVRRRIDHTIQFKTDPKQLGLAPGEYIAVATTGEATGNAIAINGVVSVDDGRILCTDELSNGKHTLTMYLPKREAVQEVEVEVQNNRVADEELWGSVFSLITPRANQNLYLVEGLELDEDGLANVTASHYPATKVGGQWRSQIAEDVLDEGGSRFFVSQ